MYTYYYYNPRVCNDKPFFLPLKEFKWEQETWCITMMFWCKIWRKAQSINCCPFLSASCQGWLVQQNFYRVLAIDDEKFDWFYVLLVCFFFHLLAHCSAFYAEKPKYLEQMLSFMLVLAQNNNNNGKHIFLSFCFYKETHRTYSKVNLNNFLLPFDGFLQIILVLLALYVDFGIDRRVTETATEKLIKNGFATNQRRSLMSDERTSLLDCNHMKQARSYTFLSCTSHSVYAQFVFCEMRTIVLDLNNKK